MTSNHHALGNAPTMLQWLAANSRKPVTAPISEPAQFDCRLQLAYVKSESLYRDEHAAVNTFSALYTPARHTTRAVTPEVGEVM